MEDYIDSLRAMNEAKTARGLPQRVYIETFGCQQNELDSQNLRGILYKLGYTDADTPEQAELILLNTCAVREHAELRALGHAGELSHVKKTRPDVIIGMCGCMMQQEKAREQVRRSYPQVSFSFGPSAIPRLPEILWRVITEKRRIFDADDATKPINESGMPVIRDGKPKAFVSIMTGCNNFCTYCIVPYTRGRERSRAPEAVTEEVRQLVSEGYSQITLLGQNVNSYRPGGGMDFPLLLCELDRIDGDFAIDFMTSHPKDANVKLFDAMSECAHVGRHLHLPFQSGSNRILEAMNRGYTREHYTKLINELRGRIPDVNLTSDVIVGFPGETEEDFRDTLALIEEVRFDNLFMFIYSKRSGTPAADMPDDTPMTVKKERFTRLMSVQARRT